MRVLIRFKRNLRAARRLVFREVTHFEDLHERFPRIFLSIRVLERSRGRAVTEESFSIGGAIITQRSEHEIRAPISHRVRVLTGDLAGSTIAETYSDSPDGGTTIQIAGVFLLGGLMSLLPQLVARPLISERLGRIFDEFDESLRSRSRP